MINRSTRRLTREYAMQFLYEAEIQGNYDVESRKAFFSFMEQLDDIQADRKNFVVDAEYFNQVIDAVHGNLNEIDKLLAAFAKNWRIERISKVDLSILRLSIAEIEYMGDIPVSVSINEAVELAKKFGNRDSNKFINGILGKIVKEKSSSE